DINRDIVLEIIRSQQPVARADLARSSGLQPSTISAIVEQLIEEKWVAEGAMARRPRGRPSTLLSLNDAMVILVADVRPNQAIVALVDLNGRFLAREAVHLVSEPARSVAKIVHCMQSMAPSATHFSSINCSTMAEMVLGCRPEERARSARATGCCERMISRTMSRLMSRAFSLDASST